MINTSHGSQLQTGPTQTSLSLWRSCFKAVFLPHYCHIDVGTQSVTVNWYQMRCTDNNIFPAGEAPNWREWLWFLRMYEVWVLIYSLNAPNEEKIEGLLKPSLFPTFPGMENTLSGCGGCLPVTKQSCQIFVTVDWWDYYNNYENIMAAREEMKKGCKVMEGNQVFLRRKSLF